jgi:zona occludens toxin (predicted ATPase)
MGESDIMIYNYTGTPGSGKSLHVAREMEMYLRRKKRTVIANFPINMEIISKKGKHETGEFIYRKNDELTVAFLIDYAKSNHKAGKESQSLIVIDEAGIMFNSRDYGSFDRKSWINFFMTHRHYGYDVILISQVDRLIDRQIRAFIEYEVRHRKANNFKTLGLILTLLRISTFVAITYLYHQRGEKCSAEFFRYRKKDGKLYDTMMLFEGDAHGESIGQPVQHLPVDANPQVVQDAQQPSRSKPKLKTYYDRKRQSYRTE